MPKEFSPTPLFGGAFFVPRIRPRNVVGRTYGDKIEKKVCQKAHLLFFMHKAPTFTSRGFAIT